MIRPARYFTDDSVESAPPPWLLAFEGSRFASEYIALKAVRNKMIAKHEGNGHPVLVFPGLFASDATTSVLREFIEDAGHECFGWDHGRNLGPGRDLALQDDIEALIRRRHDECGEKLTLIGWSLGGLYARLAAHLLPECVGQVITLGSPISGSPKFTNAWRLYEMITGQHAESEANVELLEQLKKPVSVPATSIYSRSDSIVAWQISLSADGKQQQNVEIAASHVGMAFSPVVFQVILDRLTQDLSDWKEYQPDGFMKLLIGQH